MNKQQAFTLIETLIVVLILGALISATTLSVAGVNARTNKAEVQKVLGSLNFAIELSRLSNKSLRATLDENQISYASWHDGQWHSSRQIKPVELKDGTRLSLQTDPDGRTILFLSGDEYQPFELSILMDSENFSLKGDGEGPIALR